MPLSQRMHFILDVFQMTAVALVSVINHDHINGLHLFWDTQYEKKIWWINIFSVISIYPLYGLKAECEFLSDNKNDKITIIRMIFDISSVMLVI